MTHEYPSFSLSSQSLPHSRKEASKQRKRSYFFIITVFIILTTTASVTLGIYYALLGNSLSISSFRLCRLNFANARINPKAETRDFEAKAGTKEGKEMIGESKQKNAILEDKQYVESIVQSLNAAVLKNSVKDVNEKVKELAKVSQKSLYDKVLLAALETATLHGYSDVALFILSSFADVKVREDAFAKVQNTKLLHAAIQTGNRCVFDMFIKYKYSVDSVDENGLTPLHVAAKACDEYAIERLMTGGGSTVATMVPKNVGFAPVHTAAAGCLNDSLLLMLANTPPSQWYPLDAIGQTPLMLAVELENEAAVAWMLTYQHRDEKVTLQAVNARDTQKGRTALHRAFARFALKKVSELTKGSPSVKIIDVLLKSGAFMSIADCEGLGPLNIRTLSADHLKAALKLFPNLLKHS